MTTNPRSDDELYNLIPFVKNGDTSITVDTLNPSNDDNIFFAGFFLGSTTAIVGEGILLSPSEATNPLDTEHTVTATVQDVEGKPVAGVEVTFEIIDGPNKGLTGKATTDQDGKASFTYLGEVAGTDIIVASFVNADEKKVESNQAIKIWGDEEPPNEIPEMTAFGAAAVLLIAGLFAMRKRN